MTPEDASRRVHPDLWRAILADACRVVCYAGVEKAAYDKETCAAPRNRLTPSPTLELPDDSPWAVGGLVTGRVVATITVKVALKSGG